MNQPGLGLTLAALHLLIWRAWANLEVSMEDRKEVLMGKVADIPCTFSLDEPATNPTIEWFVITPVGEKKRIHYKAGDQEPQVEATSFADRISVTYNLNTKGDSILTINGVQLSDEQQYFCRVSVDTAVDEKHTQLLVFNPPTSPSIEASQYVSADSDKLEKIATCTVENAHPTPKILWHKSGFPLQSSDEDVKVIESMTVNPNNLQMVQSELQLKMVKKEDKDAEFYCEVSYFTVGGESMVESQRVKIPVHYPSTEVHMHQVSPKRLVKEGDQVEIRCQGDGTLTSVIVFSHNEAELQSENDLLVLDNVTRLNNGQYLCTHMDFINDPQAIFNLSVHFMDEVVITPKQPAELDEGQDLTLTCNALCSLPTHTVWYKDNIRLKKGHTLTVNTITREMAGTYSCRVEAPDLPELWREASVEVTVRGKPEIIDEIEVIRMESANVFNLSCSATGHPTPSITWTLSDEQVLVSEWNTEAQDSIISIITISAASVVNASCKAVNSMGTDVVSRSVEPSEFKSSTTTTTGTFSTTTGPPTTYNQTGPTTTTHNQTDPSPVTREPEKKQVRKESSGFIIAILIILVLLLAILGSVLYFLYKKGKISCGRSGKQDLTKESASKDDFVVEMKSGKSEEAVLLQGVNGDKKISNEQ